jgi:alpha-L-rhamnosidase
MRHCTVVRFLVAISITSLSLHGQMVDPRGPIAAYQDVQVTREGISIPVGAKLPRSNEPYSKAAAWNAQWIGFPTSSHATSYAMRVRKEILLPTGRPIRDAVALVTADPFYRLWVNGHLVSRGPDDAGSDYSPRDRWSHQWLANRVDVKPYLHGGNNVIAAEVFSHHPNLTRGALGFAFRLVIRRSGDPHLIRVESGRDWSVENATAYSHGPLTQGKVTEPDTWFYDARKDDTHWRDPDFEATSWSPAQVIDSVWGPITSSRLPPMMEAVYPYAEVRGLGDGPAPELAGQTEVDTDGTRTHELLKSGLGRFLIIYDRVLSGYISLKLEGTPGSQVTIWPRELKTDGASRRPLVVILGKGITYFESPVLESFSTLEVDVADAAQPVNFEDIRANFVSQPVSYRGSFTSSDERLNTLWKASRWQTQICLQNRFMDSPDHQEPIGDPGDYLILAKVADDAFGPIPLTPQFLRQFAAILDTWMADHPEGSPNFHTSYSLLWLQTLLEYYDETGDRALAKELAPSAFRLLARYSQWIGSNGILSEAPNYLFMDWVEIGGFATHHPPAVIGQGYLTAFYYRGLGDGLRLAQLTGDSARVAQYSQQRDALRKAFNHELWDARLKLYRDGRPFLNHNPNSPNFLPPDQNIETHSPHVNVLAVLYDLAPQEEQADILDRILALEGSTNRPREVEDKSGLLNVQPYFMHFVFAAEAHAHVLAKYAPAQLARWVVNPQTQTFAEMWTKGDWSHGWGATPLIQLSSQALGVNAQSPGYATVLLKPVTLGLTMAKGTVPTPKGDVQVSWTSSKNQFIYKTRLPPATRGTLDFGEIEGAGASRVKIDSAPSIPYRLPIRLGPGNHRIVLALKKKTVTPK